MSPRPPLAAPQDSWRARVGTDRRRSLAPQWSRIVDHRTADRERPAAARQPMQRQTCSAANKSAPPPSGNGPITSVRAPGKTSSHFAFPRAMMPTTLGTSSRCTPLRSAAILFCALVFAAPAGAATCGGDFGAFLSAMSREAAAAGISRPVIDSAFAGLTQDGAVLSFDRRQRGTFRPRASRNTPRPASSPPASTAPDS
jgi:hypothetical protein